MKYIRTKVGIFDETEHRHTIRNGKVSIMGIFYDFEQADTIEGLCDEFVVIGKTSDDYYITDNLNKALKFMELRDICSDRLRGAIWTDKGLIYVAKMKGILPNGKIDWKLL